VQRRNSAIIGGVTIVAILFALYGLVQFLGGSFKPGFEVSGTFVRAGQLLHSGSDVKLRGVLVGEVTEINVSRSGHARIKMRIFPDQRVPDNVHAAIRAKTLFGEKFVALTVPAKPSSQVLVQGDEIPENRTTGPLEVETILEKAVPILNAVDPEKFGAALNALSEAFVGNEQALRHTTIQSEELLTRTERTLPNLERNLVHLQHFADALNRSDTSLLQALDGLSKVGQVLRDNPADFRATVANLTPLARNLADILNAREKDLGDLAGQGRPVLQAVADRAPKLPALVDVLNAFLGVWIKDLTPGPNWRIYVTDPNIPTGDPYDPGTAPKPRESAMRNFVGVPKGPLDPLTRIMLAPVPTKDLQQARPRGGDSILDVLR
jgi:phospholipid/cholesterol/gamma-HCH transport system substrate-binding protein